MATPTSRTKLGPRNSRNWFIGTFSRDQGPFPPSFQEKVSSVTFPPNLRHAGWSPYDCPSVNVTYEGGYGYDTPDWTVAFLFCYTLCWSSSVSVVIWFAPWLVEIVTGWCGCWDILVCFDRIKSWKGVLVLEIGGDLERKGVI